MKRVLWTVIVVGLVSRATMVAVDGGPRLRRFEPSVIADRLNAGQGFTFEQYGAVYRAWKEPLYIVLLAGLTRWAGTSPWPVLVLQTAFGLAAALGTAWITWLIVGDERTALIAGALAAANPFLVYYDTRLIHPLSFDAALFTLTTGMVLRAADARAGFSRAIWAGIAMAAALWQRAALLAAGLGAWGGAVCAAPRGCRRQVLGASVVWAVVALLVFAPWLVRNYQLFGRVLITTDAAHILWLGNNPWSNGTYFDASGRRVIELADSSLRARINGAPELVQYEVFLDETRRFIRERPGRFWGLVGRRLWAFVWFSPNAGLNYSARESLAYRGVYAALLVLGGWGVVMFWRREDGACRRRALVLLCAAAGVAAAHAMTAVNLKHRVPWELALSVFAAYAIVAFLRGVWYHNSSFSS